MTSPALHSRGFEAGDGDCGSHSQQICSSTIVILDKEMKAPPQIVTPPPLCSTVARPRLGVGVRWYRVFIITSGHHDVETPCPCPCLAAARATWPYVPLKWLIIHFNSTSGLHPLLWTRPPSPPPRCPGLSLRC